MKSNIYSIKPADLAKVVLVLLISAFLLGACRTSSPTSPPPTNTIAPSNTPRLEATLTPEDPPAVAGEVTQVTPAEGELLPEDELPTADVSDFPPDVQTEMAADSGIDADPNSTPADDDGFFTGEEEDGIIIEGEEEVFGDGSEEFDTESTPPDLLAPPQATPTPRRWPTPSNLPLGDPDNPIKIGLVVSSEADFPKIDAVQELGLQIGDLTGYTLDVVVARSYSELLNGLRARAIHIAFLQPFTYIYAKEKGYVEAGLITNHFGVFSYGTQFLANAANPDFTFFFDENTNQTTASAEESLGQLAEKRGCYVDSLSASGYIAAAGLLAQNQVPTMPPAFLQSHGSVVRALYIPGICDFGVTFALTGDPRTGAAILTDFPDIQEKVKVLWRSEGIIPNLNISYQTRLPEDVRENLTRAFLDLVQAEEGQFLLSNVNDYEIIGLEETSDSEYDTLRRLLAASGVDLITLVGK